MLDRNSPAVAKFLDTIDSEITRLHVALERIGKTPSEYDISRGKIKALRQVRNMILGDEEPDATAE
jgi:hypothetical protein